MRTIKLTLAYDGTAYAGWQRQLDRPTIQQTIEDGLATLCGERITLFGSGRTDAGVHAFGQVASFSTNCGLPVRAIQRALNVELPRDIAVLAAEEAAADFHAQKHALSKRYRYEIHNSRTADVFRRKLAWHYCWGKLDAEAMHAAAQYWLGKHDFRTFESRWPQRKSSVRTVLDISCTRPAAPDQKRIAFEVEADGFLYNMVRTMVGTLIEVGRARRPPEWAAEVLAVGDRREAGMKVPSHGLFLMHVNYAPSPTVQGTDG